MDTNSYSYVHFFNTLRDIIVSAPYAIINVEEVNSLLYKLDRLCQDVNAGCIEHAFDFRRAIDNARSDGYFPVVVLPYTKYETTLSLLK